MLDLFHPLPSPPLDVGAAEGDVSETGIYISPAARVFAEA